MKKNHKLRRGSERGVALLIAIFVLLLISVVAIALLVSSGTETALGANYRSSSTVYYAALAGLEEARGRLLQRNPISIASYTAPGQPLTQLNQPVYIINPSPGENVAPWDSSNTYYDSEYLSEFGVPVTTTASFQVNSIWVGNTYPGPMYKWARINVVTEQAIHTDVDNDGTVDTTPLLYYDLAHLDFNGNPWPSLITVPSTTTPSPPPTATQALEITALASLPNGSKKMLQYLVTPIYPSLSFPSAVTLSGQNVAFSAPTSSSFKIDGTDHVAPGVCSPSGSPPPVYAVGYTDSGDSSQTNITGAIQASNRPNYSGYGGSTPDVGLVGPGGAGPLLAGNLLSVGRLDTLVQAITQNADVVINGPATQSDMPSAMSASNPMTIVVNGDLTFNGWHNTGYGLLLVTGTFTYDPDANWEGIVLVIGKGEIYSHQSGVGTITGALFLAKTVDALGNPLPASSPLGTPDFDYTPGAGSSGVNYSSCAVQWAQSTLTYKVLAFHEIPQ